MAYISLHFLRMSPEVHTSCHDVSRVLQDFRDRLAEVIPLIQESFEYGNKLLDDKDLTEQDKDIVENDMEDIGASLKDAKQDVDQHYQWLVDDWKIEFDLRERIGKCFS